MHCTREGVVLSDVETFLWAPVLIFILTKSTPPRKDSLCGLLLHAGPDS